jgi:hypothetical protein
MGLSQNAVSKFFGLNSRETRDICDCRVRACSVHRNLYQSESTIKGALIDVEVLDGLSWNVANGLPPNTPG